MARSIESAITMAPLFLDGLARPRRPSAGNELPVDSFGYGHCQFPRGGEQNRRRVDVVLGLRQHVGGDPLRVFHPRR